MLLESVVNISEGRDLDLIAAIAKPADTVLLDLHSDPEHNRSVLTLGGEFEAVEQATRSVVTGAVEGLDLNGHQGTHPRFGVADVVPFAALDGASFEQVVAVRDRVAEWAGSELGVPCFPYGPERSLAEVRREAFRTLDPTSGPPTPHPTAGATAVGARPLLVAYNMWIVMTDGGTTDTEAALAMARGIASTIRSTTVQSLGLPFGRGAQVSCNLVDPNGTGIVELFDTVSHLVSVSGGSVERAELVGLIPAAMLQRVPHSRWAELDLSEDRTIEARMEEQGGRIGSPQHR